MDRAIKIIKNKSDIGAGTRGANLGIDAMEIAAINKGDDYFNKYPSENILTNNEVVYSAEGFPFAKRIPHVFKQCERLSSAVKDSLIHHHFPIVLSGDHSSGLGTISGIKSAYPNKRLGVVWIDAHADLHSPYTSPSGNIHGMPLAAAISNDNLECQINTPSDDTIKYWELMKEIGGEAPKIEPQDMVFFGVRDTEEPEDKQIEKLGIKNYPVHEVRYRGLNTCLNEAIEKLSHCDHIYISFDVDSLDCDMVSFGTGTPVSKGFTPNEATSLISGLLDSKKVKVLEFVEVNPLLDFKGNVMAETAFDILSSVTSHCNY